MNESLANRRKHCTERRASSARQLRRRRLVFEQVENRLMLSGNNLDLDPNTYNMDFLVNYAVISPVNDGVSMTLDRDVFASDTTTAVVGAIANVDSATSYVLTFDLATVPSIYPVFTLQARPTAPTLDWSSVQWSSFLAERYSTENQLGLIRPFEWNSVDAMRLLNPFDNVDASSRIGIVITEQSIDRPLDPSGLSTEGTLFSRFNTFVQSDPSPGALDSASTSFAGGTPGGSHTLVISALPAGSTNVMTQDDSAQIDAGQAIGGFWAQDATDVGLSQSDQDGAPAINSGRQNAPLPAVVLTSPNTRNEPTAVYVSDDLHEGGMIAVQQVVGELANSTTLVAAHQPGSADRPASEITGEIARVAVMELIEGEAEPAASSMQVDHVSYVAAVGGTAGDAHHGDANWAAKLLASEVSLAATTVLPVSPVYFAAVVAQTGGTFASAVAAEVSAAMNTTARASAPVVDVARSEAFSQWGDSDADSPRVAKDAGALGDAGHWLGAAPLLLALACERVVAAKRKRREQGATGLPIKTAPATSDAR